mgnify:FL=1
MDIYELLAYAGTYCAMATNESSNHDLATRAILAQIASACANVALAKIEHERWQDECFRAERDAMLAARKDESPF